MAMNEREYRNMDFVVLNRDNDEKQYIVEGYASTFDTYTLLTVDGIDYKERIEPTAFDDADLSDVVFRVDHTGPVYARSSAGTVSVGPDEHGLKSVTDLSRTERSRGIYEELAAGNYPQMSFAFRVADDGDRYDPDTHTRIIERIDKVFDVSPVSFPANPNTSLSVRDYFNGAIEMEKAAAAERLAAEEAERRDSERREMLKNKISEVIG